MTNATWVCFVCRQVVRSPTTPTRVVPRPHCRVSCVCLGRRIPVPPKSKLIAWRKLRDETRTMLGAWADIQRARPRGGPVSLASGFGRCMGSPSENIRLARLRTGLEPEDVARAVGLNVPWYRDVEGDDDEVTGNISLGTLMAIARTLNTTTVELLEGPGTLGGAAERSELELGDLARARIAAGGLTIEQYSERIGWDMAPVLASPEHLRRYPIVMLQALCHDLGVDWKDFVDGPSWPTGG